MPYNREVAQENGPSPFTAALRAHGMTLQSAAEEWNVGYNHIVNIARGRARVHKNVIEGFEKLTGYPVDEVVWPEQMLSRGQRGTTSPNAIRETKQRQD